jgi:hypothetical protein
MKLRPLALAVVALLLAGCGSSVHPGAAAVIGDTTISMGRLDDTARVYCRLALLSAPEGTPISNADVRRQAVTDLVFGVVARDLADEKGLRPRPTSYELKPDQRAEVAAAFPGDEIDQIVDVIVDSQRTFAIAELLGEQRVGTPDADPAQVRTEGFALIQSELARRDVRFDPRFGIGRDGLQNAPTGSLSVPAKKDAPDDKELPATQRCSA